MAFAMTYMVRYSLLGRWSNGRPVVNILDMSVRQNPAGEGVPWIESDRATNIATKAKDIADNWVDHMIPNLTSAYTFEGVGWTDLNSANGSTGQVAPTGGPAVGALGADSQPPQATLLVTKVEGTRSRGTRPGRWYLSAVRDSDIDNNGIVSPTWRLQIDGALEDFRQGVEDQSPVDDLWSVPVVIHERTATAGEITAFVTSQKMGKQGRRYDGRA